MATVPQLRTLCNQNGKTCRRLDGSFMTKPELLQQLGGMSSAQDWEKNYLPAAEKESKRIAEGDIPFFREKCTVNTTKCSEQCKANQAAYIEKERKRLGCDKSKFFKGAQKKRDDACLQIVPQPCSCENVESCVKDLYQKHYNELVAQKYMQFQ